MPSPQLLSCGGMTSPRLLGCGGMPSPVLFSRRQLLVAAGISLAPGAVCSVSASEAGWGPLAQMTDDEIAALDQQSRAAEGVLRPSGVRVIDLIVGTGQEAKRGQRVYASYKVWANGFRSGPVADLSFTDGRPYDWILGEPTTRMPPGADEGTVGMREGGWRRLVVPSHLAYGEVGLKRVSYSLLGRYVGPKAPYAIKPNATAYFDIILLDGGSGRCDEVLRPPGLSEKEASKIKSTTCLSEKVARVNVRTQRLASQPQ